MASGKSSLYQSHESVTRGEQSLSQAVDSSDYTFKKFLNLKKVVPLLYDNKTIPKSVRKLMKASEKSNNIPVFMQALLKLNLEGFALFLLALETVGDENHCNILSILATELSSVHFTPSNPSDEEAIKTIDRIQQTYFKESLHQGVPEGELKVKSDHIEMPPSDRPFSSPTPVEHKSQIHQVHVQSTPDESQLAAGTNELLMSKHETHTFSRLTQCDTFYSSAHGVSVTIPKQSFPPNVSEFKLTMTASLESSLPIDQQCYSPCSAIVSLKCNPPIEEFADYVTVEIPHCVLNVSECEEYLCVLSSPDDDSKTKGAKFEEDQDIEVDFTDGRYLMFKTKHFSRFLIAVLKRKRKQRRFSSQKKSSIEMRTRSRSSPVMPRSFEHSIQRSQSHPVSSSIESKSSSAIVEFCVAMFTPRIKEDEKLWKVIFLVTLSVPTALDEQCALRLLGKSDVECLSQCENKPFIFLHPTIEFFPPSIDKDGWKVSATSIPPLISKSNVERFFTLPKEERPAALAPHCQQYVVERVSDTPGDLKMEITVEGTDCYGEQVVFTLLQPSLCPTTAVGEIEIPSIIDLYSEDSLIRRALCDTDDTTTADSVLLSLDDRDSVSFLAELSFHLCEWKCVANLLTLQKVDIANIAANFDHRGQCFFEAAFQMLKTWTVQNCPNTSLSILLDALQRAGIVIKQRSWRNLKWCQQMDTLCSPLKEDKHQLDLFLRARLPRQIASQWKFVARFLGIKEYDIDSIAADHPLEVVEQAVQMLVTFQSRFLPVSLLRDAIHAVHEHSNCLDSLNSLRDAFWSLQ